MAEPFSTTVFFFLYSMIFLILLSMTVFSCYIFYDFLDFVYNVHTCESGSRPGFDGV